MRKSFRKPLAVLLSVIMLFTVFSVGLSPLTASAANYTILDASGTNWDGGEGAKKLIDGTVDTKWCTGLIDGVLYIVFDVGSSRVAKTYTMYTGNDTANYSTRNPRDWKLYGTNSPDHSTGSGDWHEIDSVTNDTVLGAANKTGYNFSLDTVAAYRYYKLYITATKGGIFQLSEFTMNFSPNECVWVAGVDTQAPSSEQSPNLFDGNTGTKWCPNNSGDRIYVTCDMGRRVTIDGYTITTANDNASNPGRNPKSWDILGSNDNANWDLVERVVNDTKLQNVNYTPYNFSISHVKQAYRYYKFLLTAASDAGTMQMSELKYNIVSPSSVSGNASATNLAAQNAFLGDTSLRYENAAEGAALTWDMGKSVVSTGYTLTSAGDAAKEPDAWTLYGSADGSSWTEIHTVSDASLPGTAGAVSAYAFDFLPDAYRYYKLDLTASSAASVALSGVALQYAAHSFTQFSCNNDATHQKICPECGLSVREACSGLTVTNGVCSVCGGSSAYAVTLNAPDATTAGTAAVSAVYTQAMPAVTPPQRDGYTFNGYFDAQTGGKQYYAADGSSAAAWDVLQASQLYAQWTANDDTPYLVNHYIMDPTGSYDGVSAVERLHTGTTDTTVNAADVALDIAHYSLDPDLGDASVNIDGDGSAVMDLYYKLDAFTVTFSVDGAETSADYFYGAVPAYDGETPTLAGGDANTYTFLGWTTDANAEPGSNAPYYAADALPAVTGDATYYPYFGAEVNNYDITFIVDGTESTVSFPYGATPVYDGIPAKADTAQYAYTFTGWDPAIAAVTGEATYTAQFDETVKQYPVFVTGGAGSEISVASGMVDYGTELAFTVTVDEAYSDSEPVVSVNGEALETPAGDGGVYAYTVTVTGNTEISVADLAKNTYTVTFSVDGTETETTVSYGEVPVYDDVPAKEATAQYSYTFTGWDPALAPATGDTIYTAQFSETTNQYPVFVGGGVGSEISIASGMVDYGTELSFTVTVNEAYSDSTPVVTVNGEALETPEGDGGVYGYTVEVTGNTYISVGSLTKNTYAVTFSVDGTETETTVAYGETPVYNGVPAKEATAQYTYTFIGWDPAIVPATADVTYTAQFSETTRQYPVFVNGGVGSTISIASGMRDYGTVLDFTVTVNGAYSDAEPVVTVGDTVLEKTGKTGLVFSYTHTVTGQTEISVGDLTKNTYTITFVTEDGSTEVTAAYGETPDAGFVPVKAQDAEYSYAFTGWNTAQDGSGDPLAPATADETYYAVFEPTAIPAHEHDFATFVRTVAANCVSGGYDEYICECGMTEQRNPTAIDASNHAKSAITVGAHAATAEADGYTGDQICPACGATIVEGEVIPKDGDHVHAYDTLVRHVDATCIAKAFDEYVCSCGLVKIVESGEFDPDNHAVAPITVGAREATETEYGYTGDVICTACGAVLTTGTVIPKTEIPHTHSFDTVIESHEATCIAKAYEVRKCSCGETQRIETGDVDPNNHVGEIRLLGHRDATADESGYTGDEYCLACGKLVTAGETIAPLGDPDEPTVYEHGCPYCGETHDGNFIDRLLGLIHTFLHVIRTLFRTVPKS
ncbi:MAG: discoidin domain-containing protein [Clostridia bacterium]|nr:discoidin domain-containing protein [Clostridia bacterium]